MEWLFFFYFQFILRHKKIKRNAIKCMLQFISIEICVHMEIRTVFFLLISWFVADEIRKKRKFKSIWIKMQNKKCCKLKDDTNYQLRMLSLVFIAGIVIIDTAHKYLIVFFLQLWELELICTYSKLLWIFCFWFFANIF